MLIFRTVFSFAAAFIVALATSVQAEERSREQVFSDIKRNIDRIVDEDMRRMEEATHVPLCDYYAVHGAIFAHLGNIEEIRSFLSEASTAFDIGPVSSFAFYPMGEVIAEHDLSIARAQIFARIVCERRAYGQAIERLFKEVKP